MFDRLKINYKRPLIAFLLLVPSSLLILLVYSISLILFMRFSFYDFQAGKLIEALSLSSYKKFYTDSFYWKTLYTSFKLAIHVTLLTFVLAYPVAYTINRVKNKTIIKWLTLAVFSPLLVSVVVRAYGWLTLLSEHGIVNYLLQFFNIISDPLRLVHNYTGVLLATTHVLLPFMVFTIISVLKQFDPALKEAALDLGASRIQVFLKVVLPLSIQGAVAGMQIIFPLTLSAFVTPALLGGGRVMVMPTLIYRTMNDVNWPIAAIAGLTLLVMTMIFTLLVSKLIRRISLGKSGGFL